MNGTRARRRLARAAASSGIVLLLSACGGGTSSTQTVTPGAQPTIHRVTDTDSGSTVRARVGDSIVVTLHSTYWQLTDPAGDVLVAVRAPTADSGGPSCSPVPGSGCGTVRADFRVARAGTTEIRASRTSCGEALRCTGDQGSWAVTVEASR
jgi:hypothetical protein